MRVLFRSAQRDQCERRRVRVRGGRAQAGLATAQRRAANSRGRRATVTRARSAMETRIGWGGRVRTCECRYQKPVPYHLATPQPGRRPEIMPWHVSNTAERRLGKEEVGQCRYRW